VSRKAAAAPKPVPTPQPVASPRETLVAIIEKRAVEARDHFDACMAKIASSERPISALQWSTGMFESAAALEVYREVHAALTHPDSKATVASVREWAMGMVVSSAKHTPSSTSVTANLAERMAAPAWAAVYEEADWLAREPT